MKDSKITALVNKSLLALGLFSILAFGMTFNVQANEHEIDQAQICVNELEFQYKYEGKLDGVTEKEYKEMIIECYEENKNK